MSRAAPSMGPGIPAEPTTALVRLRGLRKEFATPRSPEPLRVLDDVSFDVAAREFIAIVGPSGCGKTTLLKILAGMTSHTGGTVEIGGGKLDPSKIGMVFQHASLYPWRTVAANIAFGAELRVRATRGRRGKAERQRRTSSLVSLVGLSGFESYYPAEISGGMQQRTNLARALAINPELLLMDEPFSALDAQTREVLQIEMQQIALAASTTVVFITHDIREAVYLADRVVVLSSRPARVLDIVSVSTPRPRRFEYQVSDEFNSLTRHVWSLVHTKPANAKTDA
jgi:NitT/TauT family transport system ATP-binding protein